MYSSVTSSSGLVRVEPVKVPGDDRHRDGERQYAGDGARGADQSTPRTDRHLVSVPDRRHGDDRPPEAVRDALDLRAGLAELGVVDRARVDQKADDEGNEEQTQSLKTGLQDLLVIRSFRLRFLVFLAE